MDGECSETVKEAFIVSQNIYIQVALRNHCVNAAKKGMAKFKEYLIEAFPAPDNNYPLQPWDEFFFSRKVQDQDTICQKASLVDAAIV